MIVKNGQRFKDVIDFFFYFYYLAYHIINITTKIK